MVKPEEVMREITNAAKTFLPSKRFESVVSLEKKGNDWEATVEVLERRSVPDSQDVLGKYLFKLAGGKEVESYKQIGFRRRGSARNEEST